MNLILSEKKSVLLKLIEIQYLNINRSLASSSLEINYKYLEDIRL
jgi:hypothetical protein